MPAGLQTFDEDGNILIDTSTRTGTFLGVFNTGKSNGSVANPSLAMGAPFWSITATGGSSSIIAPVVQAGLVDGVWQIRWTFKNSGASSNSDFRVIYGVY